MLAPDEPARPVSGLIARTRNCPEMERGYEYVLEGGYARLLVTSNGPATTGMLTVNRAVGFKAVSTWKNAVMDF
jgi:hypothetical protein